MKLILSAFSLIYVFALSGCAEIKDTGRTIGHGAKDVTTTIGHATRDTVKSIGKNTEKVVSEIKDGE